MIRSALAWAAVALAGAGAGHGHHRPRRHGYHPQRAPATLFPSLHISVPAPGGGAPSAPAATPPPEPDVPPPPPPPVYPSRTGVDEGEYYVRPAHRTLAAGAVELNAHNYGMDDHDITVDDADGHRIAQAYLTAGADAQLELDLPAGSYRVYCSLYGGAHDQAGMHAALTVVSASRRR